MNPLLWINGGARLFAENTSKDGYTVTLLVPKGTTGAYIGNVYGAHAESEFLLDKGQKFKKVSIDEKNKTAILEVIL